MAHELRHAVHNVFKGAAELVLPVRTDSAFAESGVRPVRRPPRPAPPARPRLRGRARPAPRAPGAHGALAGRREGEETAAPAGTAAAPGLPPGPRGQAESPAGLSDPRTRG